MTKNLSLFFVLLLFGCKAKVENAPESKKSITPNTPATVVQPMSTIPSGIFLGKSEEKYGDMAWLICLDPANHKGKLYDPLGVLNLSLTNASGQSVLRSERAGSLAYVFELNLSQQLLVGTVTRLEVFRDSSKPFYKAEVSFERLASFDTWPLLYQSPSGVYRNVRNIQETGDLLGAELVLIRKPEGVVGLITIFEGGPDSPYLLLDTDLVGNQLRFKIKFFDKLELFSTVISRGRLKLIDETSPLATIDSPLLMRRSLSTLFGPDCNPKKEESGNRKGPTPVR